MAVLKIKRGATSQIVDVWIGDSTSTAGAGKTGLAYNTSGLTLKYQESDAASGTTATLASMTEGTWTSGGFVESNIGQGWYQIGIPNAAIDSGTRTKFVVYGATGMVTTPFYIELDAIDYQDGVRAGLTALPNAAAEASGGLITRGTGTGQLSVSSGQVIIQSGTGTGQLDFTSGVVKANATQFAGQTITCSGGVTIPAATLASTTNITAGTITTTTNLTNAPPDSSGVTTLLTRIGDTITISGGRVNANTTHFGGTAGTFTVSGIPVVDLKYYLGTDLSTPNYIPVNVHQVATKNASAPGTVVRFQEYVGSATTYLAVDSNGYVTYNNSPTIPSVNDIWNAATRTLTAATNITSDGNTISQTQLANLDATVSSRFSSASFVVRSNTAQSGSTSTTIKLDASASATANLYRGLTVLLTGGTGAGQARTITGYNGTTKIANVDRAWITTPDNTSTFALLGTNSPSLNTTLQVSTAAASATIRTGTAQSGSTSNTIKLDAGASATNSVYVGNVVSITSGIGLGQTRTIVSYNGTTKVATVDRNWTTTPDNTSVFSIVANINPTQFSDQGVAQAATSGSITLAATASATDDIYNGSIVTILSGTAAGETSEITDYNGTTKVATVSPNFGSTPDSTSAYAVIPTTSGTGATVGDVPTATQIRIEMDTNSTQLAAILDDTGTTGVVVASGSKTGYSLASTGLDSISTTAPSGVASNFREMLVQVWRRFFKKTVYDNSANTIKTYADDGTTIVTTQTATSAAGVETQGSAT